MNQERRIEITGEVETVLIQDSAGLRVEMDGVVESHDVTGTVSEKEWKEVKSKASTHRVSLDKAGKTLKLETRKQAKPE